MRAHFSEYWGGYAFTCGLIGIFLLFTGAVSNEKAQTNYCFDRGMVVVKTDAGPRCAPLYSLERIR